MALVKLDNVTVIRINSRGFGVQVKESDRQVGDQTIRGDRYTVWFKQSSGLSEGDTVSVSGFLSAKVSEWTDKEDNVRHTVELSVNSPRVDGFPAKGAPPELRSVLSDLGTAHDWATNDESPF